MNSDQNEVPEWVQAAALRPVAFAQVREDPRIDRWLVERCAKDFGSSISMIQIASGGCTAALMAGMPQVTQLSLVDPNFSQLGLTRLKLRLLSHHPPAERMAVLGHAEMPAEARVNALRTLLDAVEIPPDSCGPLPEIAAEGIDHAGRYELVFSALRSRLRPFAGEMNDLLRLHSITDQIAMINPAGDLWQAFDEAFTSVLALPNLVFLFGEKATGNAVQSFSQHFLGQLRQVLTTIPAATNPFLWQMLCGTYPHHHQSDWIMQPSPVSLPKISWICDIMDSALASVDRDYHIVHLSNILDWLTPEQAQHTLKLACKALCPGGYVIIRQLNSMLDIPSLYPHIRWLDGPAKNQHATDRSFFYRSIHIGQIS